MPTNASRIVSIATVNMIEGADGLPAQEQVAAYR